MAITIHTEQRKTPIGWVDNGQRTTYLYPITLEGGYPEGGYSFYLDSIEELKSKVFIRGYTIESIKNRYGLTYNADNNKLEITGMQGTPVETGTDFSAFTCSIYVSGILV